MNQDQVAFYIDVRFDEKGPVVGLNMQKDLNCLYVALCVSAVIQALEDFADSRGLDLIDMQSLQP